MLLVAKAQPIAEERTLSTKTFFRFDLDSGLGYCNLDSAKEIHASREYPGCLATRTSTMGFSVDETRMAGKEKKKKDLSAYGGNGNATTQLSEPTW